MDSEPVLHDLIKRIVDAVNPQRILLFGSAARGDMTEASDFDVLVVVHEGVLTRAAARQIYRNLVGFSKPVDVVVATDEMLERHGRSLSFVYRPALTEGRIIYAA